MSLYDVQKMMDFVKKQSFKKTMAKIEKDPTLATNLDIDSNNIEEMLVFSYFLKIFKLVIIILNLSYLFGVMWILLCEAVFDF